MITKIDIALADTADILKNHGLETAGKVQRFFSENLMLLADEYVPFESGTLKNSARVVESGDAIFYNGPYARYHWYGKIYVDPVTKAACFLTKDGPRSRKNVQKIPTEREMNYRNGALRGPMWVERCYLDRKDELLTACEKIANGGR